MKMQCVLADDEPLARKGIANFIKEIPFLELTDSCTNALQVMDTLTHKKIDLLFLDIQMPKMNGIDLLRSMPHSPITIITTAYPNYAVESYELAVIDYLLKPIPFDRFVKAVNKAKEYFELQRSNQLSPQTSADYCFIKCDGTYEKIYYKDILYVEALQNYVVINLQDKKYISYLTLKAVEDHLPASQFLKINKSFLISIQKIEQIEGNEIIINGKRLQIGRTFKSIVMETILNNRILKR